MRQFFLTVCVLALIAKPLVAAANVCDPENVEEFAVAGVQQDDTLNVRSGPTTKYPVIEELLPTATGISYGADKYFLEWECQSLCRSAIKGNQEANKRVQSQCFQKNQVWFEIVTPTNKTGWVSAKYLKAIKVKSSNDLSKGGAGSEVVEPKDLPIAENKETQINPEERENILVFFGTYELLRLCSENNYLTYQNIDRIEKKYKTTVASYSISSDVIAELETEAKEHWVVAMREMHFVQNSGIWDANLQTECNDLTAAFLYAM